MSEQLSLKRSKTTVLIMDYQNRQLSYFSGDFQNELIARANKVLEKARHKDIPVVYAEVRRGERTPETEIHPAVITQPGEPVLTKSRFGLFSPSEDIFIGTKKQCPAFYVTGPVIMLDWKFE